MKKTLLLNGDWQPLNFITQFRAILLVLNGRAEIIDIDGNPSVWEGEYLSSPSCSFQVPATIRLRDRINRKWGAPRFRKKVMFLRDGWICQYCSQELNKTSCTIDHVFPKSRGGQTSWKNCVASCYRCNLKKGNKTPQEAGMRLLSNPREPTPVHFWEGTKSQWHMHWKYFLESYTHT